MEYTISLALEDFIPVILSSIGLFLISDLLGVQNTHLKNMARLGWGLITMGGFLKAVWKLIMAISMAQIDIVWLDKGLFVWLAPGFTLVAYAVWVFNQHFKNPDQRRSIFRAPAALLTLIAILALINGFPDAEANAWRFALLGVTTLANVVLVIQLMFSARRMDLRRAAQLFLLHIGIIFLLSGIARIPDQTIPLQWLEQILNTIAQGLFLVAARQLSQRVWEGHQLATHLAKQRS